MRGSGTENELNDGGGVNEKGAESDCDRLEELGGRDARKHMQRRGTNGRRVGFEKGGDKQSTGQSEVSEEVGPGNGRGLRKGRDLKGSKEGKDAG